MWVQSNHKDPHKRRQEGHSQRQRRDARNRIPSQKDQDVTLLALNTQEEATSQGMQATSKN